ncbi:putative aldehyde reductase ii [Phaeomoniella chlamydospora]|uniref:Putative aldehyde reductase ii n=1 Tax=Phaeomoniella chlamydospora TaxID=158046 RepID=A0A0G2F0J5_PHACM|nr:putative aldehyde reductase ii [Phaeomoniella chlamydospora]
MAQTSQFTPSDVILVTGANGHVAQHIVDQILNHPGQPRVLATVRSETSAVALRDHYSEYLDRLSFAFISDIKASGAFDEVLGGSDITYIAHVASPVVFKVEDIERDILEPAVRGTTSLLHSALKAPKLKGVVVTGSFAAVFDATHGYRLGYTYTDNDWNPITWEEAADPKLDLTKWPEVWHPFLHYCASKKLAEKALWDFIADIIRQVYPNQPLIPKQNCEHYSIDSETPRKVLGLDEYVTKEQMFQDAVCQLLELAKE